MDRLGTLARVKLEGFRSIRQLDLELRPLNILIGANGAGKSNFISFFKFMNKLQEKELQLHVRAQLNGADRTLYFGRKTTNSIRINLHFPPNSYWAELVPTTNDGLVFARETALFHGDEAGFPGGTKTRPLAKAGDLESSLPTPGYGNPALYVATYISDWKVYHFHDTSDTAKVKGTYSVFANERLMPQGDNLAAFLLGIKESQESRHQDAYKKIVGTIQRVAPFFHDFVFTKEPNDLIRLRWKHKGSDDYFDATMLSDGTLRFICLATLLLQPNLPTILLLDEPELGLHPYAIQLLAAMMRSASHTTQIIASTQSVTLANEFGWDDIIVVDQKNNESVFQRLKEEQVKAWLDDYRTGDLWEKNLLGGTPE